MGGKRQFGSIRKLPSGKYQARYPDAVGQLIPAPTTFDTKADAGRYLDQIRTDQDRGAWIDPRAGHMALREYAWGWLALRPDLRPRTQELYEGYLRLHILPPLGDVELGSLSTARVRAWHAGLIAAGKPGRSTVAKAYRLLSTIMRTAVEDELIIKNPCILKKAGVERPPERPIATVAQVYDIADLIGGRFRILVLLATFTGLRLGELQALRRRHVDLERGTLRVVEQTQLLRDGTLVTGPPKTDAGVRTVAIPAAIMSDLAAHLDEHSAPGPDGLVIPGPGGVPFRRGTLYTEWQRVLRVVDVEGLRFHDLRHTGNTLAASTGASTKELMARMGHASPRAALIYQHATAERDRAIADALSAVIEANTRPPRRPPSFAHRMAQQEGWRLPINVGMSLIDTEMAGAPAPRSGHGRRASDLDRLSTHPENEIGNVVIVVKPDTHKPTFQPARELASVLVVSQDESNGP